MTAQELTEAIIGILSRYAAGEEDRYGFSELDTLLGKLRAFGEPLLPAAEAVRAILPLLAKGEERGWEGLRYIIEASGLKSPRLAKELEQLLDDPTTPSQVRARFEAIRAWQALGGCPSKPRLLTERALLEAQPGLWTDLALTSLEEAPEAVAELLTDFVAGNRPTLSWQEVRKRLPRLYQILGREFPRVLRAVLQAFDDVSDRQQLAKSIDRYYDLGMSRSLTTGPIHSAEHGGSFGTGPIGVPEASLEVPLGDVILIRVVPSYRRIKQIRKGHAAPLDRGGRPAVSAP